MSIGQTGDTKMVEFAAMEVTELLIKPYTPHSLLDAICRQLKRGPGFRKP